MKSFYLTLFFLSSFCFAHGTTYYVSNSGSDSNTGESIADPWLSMSQVNSINFLPGDQILFHRGDIWNEGLVISNSGTAAQKILYGAWRWNSAYY